MRASDNRNLGQETATATKPSAILLLFQWGKRGIRHVEIEGAQ
jgi:hypothetical protein